MSCFNLASQWNLRADKADFQTIPARVPGDNYSALLEAGVIPDPYLDRNEDLVQWVRECNWIYSRDFELDQEFLDQESILLNISVFQGILDSSSAALWCCMNSISRQAARYQLR